MRWRLGCLFCLWALSCRPPRPDSSTALSMEAANAQQPATTGGNTLGAGDLVEIRVYQEADLSGTYRLSQDGVVDFPLCGKVTLAGKTSGQAADVLTRCLAEKYLKHPQVSVLVREYNSKKIYVLGEVNRPGTFAYDENMSIIQAITLAGGFTKQAARNSTSVTRLVAGQEQKIRVPVEEIGVGREKNFQLDPGDIVFVPESFF
jgi:protein involved in polysaccharide export with SLBB domain